MTQPPSSDSSFKNILTQEQEALLDLYLQNLDNFFQNQKDAAKIQVEIETLHLKKILSA